MSVMAGHFGSRPDTRINMMFSIRFFGVCHVSLTIGSYADEDAGRSEDFLRAPRCLVGMVCNLAKRILHVSGGGDWDTWRDQSPFIYQRDTPNSQPGQTSNSSPLERKLKMTQADDGEFVVQSEDVRAGWYHDNTSQSSEVGLKTRKILRWNR